MDTDLVLAFERLAALLVPVPIPMQALRWVAYRFDAIWDTGQVSTWYDWRINTGHTDLSLTIQAVKIEGSFCFYACRRAGTSPRRAIKRLPFC